MSGTVLVRFSSLGDIVLTGAVTAALAPVTYVTSQRYRQVAQCLPGVEEVIALGDGMSLRQLARRIPPADRMVDLHASPRSRLLRLLAGGNWSSLRRHDIRRRLRVAFKWEPAPAVVQRYADAAKVLPSKPPWLPVNGPRDALVLVPGASRSTKMWPARRFSEVANQLGWPVLILGGPAEEELCQQVARRLACSSRVICQAGFAEVLDVLGQGRLVLGGDTGLVHLCVAAGIPSVLIFGSTCSRDGFWPWALPRDELWLPGEPRCVAVELDLYCRPCSLHGAGVCPFGDVLCMDAVDVNSVLDAIYRVWTPRSTHPSAPGPADSG